MSVAELHDMATRVAALNDSKPRLLAINPVLYERIRRRYERIEKRWRRRVRMARKKRRGWL